MKLKHSVTYLSKLVFMIVLFNCSEIYGQQNSNPQSTTQSDTIQSELQNKKELPAFYGHFFGGMGFSYLSASDIKSLLGDDFGIGIGLPTWSYGLRCGFKNIVQVEYNFGKADHDFNNNSIIPDVPSEVIKMDYDTKDIQFKINPKFWKTSISKKGYTKVFFLIAGFGDVEWRDKNDDGFKGESNIFGIEYALLSKHTSLSFSFKRYGIQFNETTLYGIPFEHKTDASDYIFEMKFGFGTGI